MRFSLTGSQVIKVLRPVRVALGDDMAPDMSTDAGFNYDYMTQTQPVDTTTAPASAVENQSWQNDPNFQAYNPGGTDAAAAAGAKETIAQQAAPASTPTDWGAIFGTSAKALATLTPAVTGVLASQQQNKAQQAANALALTQSQLNAQRGAVAAPASALPSWVIPAAIGGVVLLAAGFFLTKMPRSAPTSAPAPATNPRRRRRRYSR